MRILGLTGSIGMGKSATAAMFRDAGVPVYDADAAVHALYRGTAVPLIEAAFPGTTRHGAVERAELAKRVLGNAAALGKLEAIVHPLVREDETKFLAECRTRSARLVVLDIPLLLETKRGRRVDAIIVVSADSAIQRARVLARPNMDVEKFEAILAKQMPDAEKRRMAHFVIETGQGFAAARQQVGDILRAFAARRGRGRG